MHKYLRLLASRRNVGQKLRTGSTTERASGAFALRHQSDPVLSMATEIPEPVARVHSDAFVDNRGGERSGIGSLSTGTCFHRGVDALQVAGVVGEEGRQRRTAGRRTGPVPIRYHDGIFTGAKGGDNGQQGYSFRDHGK